MVCYEIYVLKGGGGLGVGGLGLCLPLMCSACIEFIGLLREYSFGLLVLSILIYSNMRPKLTLHLVRSLLQNPTEPYSSELLRLHIIEP